MNDIEVFGHIEAVRTAITVDFVTAVIHSEADESIVVLPIAVNESGEHSEVDRVCAELTESFGAFGAEFVHNGVVITVIYYNNVVLVTQDDLSRHSVGARYRVALFVVEIVDIAV